MAWMRLIRLITKRKMSIGIPMPIRTYLPPRDKPNTSAGTRINITIK